MRIVGLPEHFWVVTTPTPKSELGDICFQCDFVRFALQIRGGLNENEIVGIYVDEEAAITMAESLLQAITLAKNESCEE